jgi:hypothetical protein
VVEFRTCGGIAAHHGAAIVRNSWWNTYVKMGGSYRASTEEEGPDDPLMDEGGEVR